VALRYVTRRLKGGDGNKDVEQPFVNDLFDDDERKLNNIPRPLA